MDCIRCRHAYPKYQRLLRRREKHAQYGQRGDRIGEAAQPGPGMEAPVRVFSGAKDAVFPGVVGLHSRGLSIDCCRRGNGLLAGTACPRR